MKYIKSLSFLLLFSYSLFSCKTNVVANHSVKEEVNYIPYYLKVYEADSLYIEKNYEKSYAILDSLFKRYTPLELQNYAEYTTYYKLKIILNKKIDKKEFLELIRKYDLTDYTLKNDSIFNIYYSKEKSYIDGSYVKLRNEFEQTINIKLRNEIKEMSIQDQLYRNKNYKANIEKQNKIDSLNSKRIIEIFNEYGYPSEKIIGDSRNDKVIVNIETMLLHTKDKERKDYFLPKLLEYIKAGKAPPKVYATMFDQQNLYNGIEQYYGSYTNKLDVPVKELNRRRKTIGLFNYGYEEWRIKKLYPGEEY
jgi:hypothetical protein